MELTSGGTAEKAATSDFRADSTTEELLDSLISRSNPDSQRIAIEGILTNGGTPDRAVVEAIASQMGIEPDLAGGAIQHAAAGVENAVYGHLEEAHGVFDRDAFARFVHSSPKTHNATMSSARNLMASNSTTGFEITAQEFRATADRHAPQDVADALADAGIPYQITRSGEFVLDMRHAGKGQMAFRQAVELGLITLHKNR